MPFTRGDSAQSHRCSQPVAGVKYAVWYPKSGIHECPFGRKQAEMVWFLALREGINAKIATSTDGKFWVY